MSVVLHCGCALETKASYLLIGALPCVNELGDMVMRPNRGVDLQRYVRCVRLGGAHMLSDFR